jgi:hypothetical protein
MRRPIRPVIFMIVALLLGAAFVFAGCKDLSDTKSTEGATTTTEQVAGTTSTLPHLTVTTSHAVTTDEPILVTKRFEQNDPKLHWLGPWTFTGGADDSGGSCVYTEDTSASVTLRFTGVSISLVTRLGLAVGNIKVTLDGGAPFLIDCYNDVAAYQQIMVIADPLDNGVHTVKLECAGSSNPASGGTGIYIDAFAITGQLQAF